MGRVARRGDGRRIADAEWKVSAQALKVLQEVLLTDESALVFCKKTFDLADHLDCGRIRIFMHVPGRTAKPFVKGIQRDARESHLPEPRRDFVSGDHDNKSYTPYRACHITGIV